MQQHKPTPLTTNRYAMLDNLKGDTDIQQQFRD